MLPSVYTGIYETPSHLRPPAGMDMFDNIEQPNLNSAEYRRQPIERTIKMHPVWERIAMNSQKQILIATNKCSGREWCSTMWAYENVNVIDSKNPAFRLQVNSLVTNIAYMSNNMVLGTFRNGGVQLWSTYSEVRNTKQPYSLFSIAKQYEHYKAIESLDTMGPNRAITGSKDCSLKIWDMGEADLRSINTYRFAHVDTITGIAVSKSEHSIFATVGLDKSVLLWDTRLVLPAIALLEDHIVSFREVIWDESKSRNYDTHVWVGDDSGKIHLIDKRSPKRFVRSKEMFIRPIRKIAIDGDNLAVIANSNIVKILSISRNEVIYENNTHQHFVRDCLWYDSTRLLTVGSDGQMCSHTPS